MARRNTKSQTSTATTATTTSYLDRIEAEVQANQSKFSLILGGIIVLIAGLLIFNYLSKDNTAQIGPSQQTQQAAADVTPENLPGKYTVKEGDTLFLIAENYYKNGYKFEDIAKANNMNDVNLLAVGQVLEIPKLEVTPVAASEPTASATPTESPEVTPTPTPTSESDNRSQWGEPITGNSYTIAEGDWLSVIAGRAYGDVMAFSKIAQANNIQNPDVIEPGMVLTIPR